MRCRSRYEQILFASKRTLESTGRAAAYAPAVVVVPNVVLAVAAFRGRLTLMPGF